MTSNKPVSGSIVVGVDQSQHGQRALTVALDLARRLHVPCHVVHAWAYPSVALAGPYAGGAWTLVDLGPEENTWLADLLASIEPGGVAITSEVRNSAAGPALVDIAASLRATLIVVGSVGHGAIVGALLGSVSEYCVHHALCPVVVVPPQARALKGLQAHETPAVAAATHP